MDLSQLKSVVKKDDFIWVRFDDDFAEGIFDSKGELKLVLDKYHGGNGDIVAEAYEAVGITLHNIHVEHLLERNLTEEELEVDSTDEIPILDEILKVLKNIV